MTMPNDRAPDAPLEGEILPATMEGGMAAQINASEINQQIATAHRFPRSIATFRKQALERVTLSESIARECIYALPRDKKIIEGPSARFAEIIASAYRNMRCGARVVSDTGDFIVAQGVAHDLEANVAIAFEVQRRITDSKGKRYSMDMIGVTGNAASSIALRNAILKAVPKAFWSDIYAAAKKVIVGDVKTLHERRATAMKELAVFGATEAQVLAVLGRAGVQDVTIDDLVVLAGILTALKEGDTTVEEAFPAASTSIRTPERKSEKAEGTPDAAQGAQAGGGGGGQAAAVKVDNAGAQGGGGGQQQPEPKLTASMTKMIRKKMDAAKVTDAQLAKQFGIPEDQKPLEVLPASKVNDILAWVQEMAEAAQ